MKKLIIMLVLAVAAIAANAQTSYEELQQQMFELRISQLADTVVLIDSLVAREIIVATDSNEYYLTYHNYALQFDHAFIQVWNTDGERTRIWMRKGEELEIELPAEKARIPINAN